MFRRNALTVGLTAAFVSAAVLLAAGTGVAHDDGADRGGNNEVPLMVILGASYAKGWSPSGLPGVEIVNHGVSGEQSDEMLARFDRDVATLRPDSVVLWGFINDVFRAPKTDIAERLSRTKDNFGAMIGRARAAGIRPILATEVTIRHKAGWMDDAHARVGRLLGRASYQDYVNGHVREMNAWLRELARSEGLLLLDFESVVSGADGARRREYAQEDGSHISPNGYAAIDRYAAPLLRAHAGAEAQRNADASR
jgi:lysophospholipase L1-like esterase